MSKKKKQLSYTEENQRQIRAGLQTSMWWGIQLFTMPLYEKKSQTTIILLFSTGNWFVLERAFIEIGNTQNIGRAQKMHRTEKTEEKNTSYCRQCSQNVVSASLKDEGLISA